MAGSWSSSIAHALERTQCRSQVGQMWRAEQKKGTSRRASCPFSVPLATSARPGSCTACAPVRELCWTTMTPPSVETLRPLNSPAQVLFASLIGTTIEFFDFYIYATAAVLVFPKLFFPSSDPASATLASLATFAVAFFARPIGSAFFGHFGDRIGRKTTLVAALLTMGVSTVSIGLLPTYATIGLALIHISEPTRLLSISYG